VGHSVIGWQRVSGATGVSGQVVAPGSLTPIQAVQVSFSLLPILQGQSGTVQGITDIAGRFHIESISPARYLMVARRLGYRAAHDTVVIARDSGMVSTVILVPDNMTIDECGMMYQEVRVPWWERK
jgi:Carboxypeptidase regulatory-like domain